MFDMGHLMLKLSEIVQAILLGLKRNAIPFIILHFVSLFRMSRRPQYQSNNYGCNHVTEMESENGLKIGGTKGHIEETVYDPVFITIYNAFRWKMIPNCTGRYTCRDHKAVSHLAPRELLQACGIDQSAIESFIEYKIVFEQSRRKDPIHVIPFAVDRTTGLISYVKSSEEGIVTFVHTMNSCSGFQRKHDALNVVLTDACIIKDI